MLQGVDGNHISLGHVCHAVTAIMCPDRGFMPCWFAILLSAIGEAEHGDVRKVLALLLGKHAHIPHQAD